MKLSTDILYRVGVDGGGSSTRARITLADGTPLGEGKAGASGLMQGIPQAWRHIEWAMERAAQTIYPGNLPPPDRHNCAVGIGVAGFNNPQWRSAFMAANPGYSHLAVDTDVFTALLGAHQGQPGALVIAGTGTVAQARHADGRRLAAGGWGFPSGDEGGGAVLGLQAVNLAQQASDGRRAPSPLTTAVLQAIGSQAVSLLAWCCTANQAAFASLAPLVFDCEAHDPAAAQLLAQAQQSIEKLVTAVDPHGQLPLVAWGSVGQRLAPRFAPAVQARLVPPRTDALQGALQLLALQFP
ncbi:BadF/BadG/BcrA/BcrD ATPase family protein [Rhodoferax sp. WC2427]|uniref:BadF/BadG/BcrA/BcrD ATPase family protein n=1 Tax=Rhodoferax sp. WC2427 TaxID=3234144 RepID=UPI003466F755